MNQTGAGQRLRISGSSKQQMCDFKISGNRCHILCHSPYDNLIFGKSRQTVCSSHTFTGSAPCGFILLSSLTAFPLKNTAHPDILLCQWWTLFFDKWKPQDNYDHEQEWKRCVLYPRISTEMQVWFSHVMSQNYLRSPFSSIIQCIRIVEMFTNFCGSKVRTSQHAQHCPNLWSNLFTNRWLKSNWFKPLTINHGYYPICATAVALFLSILLLS